MRRTSSHLAAEALTLLESPLWAWLREEMQARILKALADRDEDPSIAQHEWIAFQAIETILRRGVNDQTSAVARETSKRSVA